MQLPSKTVVTATAVPKIVHQIWFNFDKYGDIQPVPAKYDRFRDSIRSSNPDWLVRTWNEADADRLLTPVLRDRLRSFPQPIQKADFFRWIVLFRFGGCYADMDCLFNGRLDDVIPILPTTQVLVVPSTFSARNAMIIATPFHPVVGTMVDRMRPRFGSSLRSVYGVFQTTGPAFVSKILKQFPKQVVYCDRLLWHVPESPFSSPPSDTIAVHAGLGSWNYKTCAVLDGLRLLLVITVIIGIGSLVRRRLF